MKTFTSVIIVAAGSSSRMCGEDKIMFQIHEKPLIYYTIEAFEKAPSVDEIIVVTRKENIDEIKSLNFIKLKCVTEGGSSRKESVESGFKQISNNAEYVSIHDGARPLISVADIEKTHQKAYECGACFCGFPLVNTIKEVDMNGVVLKTLNRANLISVATPQTFSVDIYKKAIEICKNSELEFTDDAGMVEFSGFKVNAVICSVKNIKVTTREDVVFIEKYLQTMKKE